MLPLDKDYPGASSIQVTLWADTGTVTHVVAISYGGSNNVPSFTPSPSPLSSPTPTLSPTQQPTQSPSPTPTSEPASTHRQQTGFLGTRLPIAYCYAIIVVLVIVVVAGLSFFYFKKLTKN